MAELHFLRPYFLFGLIPLALVGYLLWKKQPSNNAWRKICDPHLLNHLLVKGQVKHYHLFFVTMFIAGALMLFALAGPSWKKLPQASYAKKQATVIVLDASSLMLGQDIRPNRMERAKYKIIDLLKKVKEGQVGLVIFSQQPFLASPLTSDNETLIALLQEVNPSIMPIDGSNIANALHLAGALIQQGGFSEGNILLLTANPATEKDITEAANLHKQRIQTSVLAVATKLGAPVTNAYGYQTISKLDSKSLSALARAGGGLYLPFTKSTEDIRSLVKLFSTTKTTTYDKESQTMFSWQDEGRYFILLALPLILLGFRRGLIESILR